MSTAADRNLEEIKGRIDALRAALANQEKIVRYADGTYVEFNSFEELSQRLGFFQSELATAETGSPRPKAVRLRVTRHVF